MTVKIFESRIFISLRAAVPPATGIIKVIKRADKGVKIFKAGKNLVGVKAQTEKKE